MLAKIKDKYKKIFDLSPDVIMLLDTKEKIVDVNRRIYDWLGYKPKEVIGKTLSKLSFLPEKSKLIAKERFSKRIRGKEVLRYELDFTTKKGEIRVGVITGTTIKDENEKIIGTLAMITDITERKQAEATLLESESKYRTTVENINDALVIHDFNGKIIDVNRIACTLFGSKRDLIIGKNVRKFTTEDPRRTSAQRLAQVITRESLLFETGVIRNDGSITPVSINAKLVSKQGEGIIQSFVRDITERKKADEKINHLNLVLRTIRNVNQLIVQKEESGRLLKDICNILTENRGYFHAWIVLLDRDGKCVMSAEAGLSKSFAPIIKKMKGGEIPVCGQKALRQSHVVIIKNPRAICVGCSLAEMYRDKAAMAIQLEYAGKIYGVLSVSIPVELIADKEEHALFKEVAGDIAFALYNMNLEEERKRIEEALQESEQKYRALVESATDNIFMINKDNKVLSVNQAAAKLFAKETEEITGKSIFDLFPEEIAKGYSKSLKEVFATGIPMRSESKMVARGRESWINVSLSPVKDQKGNVVAVMGVTRDITKRKQVEEALQKRTHDIGERVKELNCLIGISKIMSQAHKSVNELLPRIVQLIPPSWQYPDITCARISYEGQEFTTINFKESNWKQTSDIEVHGKKVGVVEVYYLEKKPESDEGPFLKDERHLINAFAREVGEFIERKRAAEELQASEEKYRILLENLPQKIFYKNKDSVYISCNDNYARDLQIKTEQIAGKTDYDFYPKELADKYRRDDKRLMEAGKIEDIEEKYIQDGQEVWVHTVKTPVRDEKGNVIGIQGIFWDITEHKKAEDKIKQQHELLNNTLESLTHPFYVIDANDYTIKLANSTTYEGPLPNGLTCYALVYKRDTPCSSAEHLCPLEEVKRTKKAVTVEHAHYDKDNNPKIVEVHGYPIFDSEGDVVQMIEYCLDITDRKKAEEALQKSEEKYKTLTENINVGIYRNTIGPKGKFIEVNPAIVNMFGYKNKEKILAIDVADLYQNPEDRKKFNKKILTDGFVKNEEELLKKKDGTPIICSVSTVAVKDEQGKVVYYDGIIEDITERKRAEKFLKETELKFRTIFDQANDGILVADIKNKKFVTGNKMICEMLGYTIDEIKDLGVMDIHSKESLPYVIEQFEKQQRGEIKVAKDIPVKTKNGSIFYADVNSTLTMLDGKQCLLGFFRDITERKRTEEERNKLLFKVNERVKELNCLFEVTKIIETPDLSSEEIFQRIVDVIPVGWQYPEIICARIIIDKQKYTTVNFKITKWKQSTELMLNKKKTGIIEVYYLEEKPNINEGPFLKEKRNLINAIAERLNSILERKHAEEKLAIKLKELEDFNRLAVDRELKMIELKEEINKLLAEHGMKQKYEII